MEQINLPGMTMCVVKAGLAAGTTSTISTTGATVYSIDGEAYSVAAKTSAATPTVDAVTNTAFALVRPGIWAMTAVRDC